MTYVIGLIVVVAVLALVGWYVRRPPPLDLGDSTGRCGGCVHWDWSEGQQALQAHRPFAMVMQELQPWQMAQVHRDFVPNEEYERVKAQLLAAVEAHDDARAKELQDRLDVLNPKRISDTSNAPPPEYRGLTWMDFGACRASQIITSRADTCSSYQLITPAQLLRNTTAERTARAAKGGAS